MEIVLNTSETLPMEVSMDNNILSNYLEGKVTAEEAQKAFWDNIDASIEEYEASRKDHELHFEISIAWDDDDGFEHEGYYNSVDDAIEALLKYKK